MKNCDECVFGIYYTSDGTLTRICGGKNVPEDQAISAINETICDMYNEGRELYKRYKNGEFENLSASQRYIIDRKDFSKEPTALCASFAGEPNDRCMRGENGYCYCRLECTSQENLDGSGRSRTREELMDMILNN